MSGYRKALDPVPVAWRIFLEGSWVLSGDSELAERKRANGYAVESLFSREQLQSAWSDGHTVGYAAAIKMVAEGE